MFREMRRKKQQLSQAECLEVLRQEPRGVLSVLGDGDWPYGIPLDFWYCQEDGTLCFHGSRTGHKMDAFRRCDKASFCVMDQGFRREGEWALNIRSVIVFGRIRLVEDHQRALEICRNLGHKFTQDEAYLDEEIRRSGPGVQCFVLVPEHMTGKLVNES